MCLFQIQYQVQSQGLRRKMCSAALGTGSAVSASTTVRRISVKFSARMTQTPDRNNAPGIHTLQRVSSQYLRISRAASEPDSPQDSLAAGFGCGRFPHKFLQLRRKGGILPGYNQLQGLGPDL